MDKALLADIYKTPEAVLLGAAVRLHAITASLDETHAALAEVARGPDIIGRVRQLFNALRGTPAYGRLVAFYAQNAPQEHAVELLEQADNTILALVLDAKVHLN